MSEILQPSVFNLNAWVVTDGLYLTLSGNMNPALVALVLATVQGPRTTDIERFRSIRVID
jgi:hypothetical protein